MALLFFVGCGGNETSPPVSASVAPASNESPATTVTPIPAEIPDASADPAPTEVSEASASPAPNDVPTASIPPVAEELPAASETPATSPEPEAPSAPVLEPSALSGAPDESAPPDASGSPAFIPALSFEIPEPLPATDTSGMELAAERRTESRNYMGTYCQIIIYDYPSDAAYEEAYNMIAHLDKILTSNAEGSEVDWINRHAGIAPVQVSELTFNAIKRALEISELSGGALEITLGPIIKLWNIGFPEARVPSAEEIENALPLVNYKNVELDETNRTVFLKLEGMRLDLGAVVKGYAADLAAEILRRHGVNNAIVNMGGNLLMMGGNVQKGADFLTAGIQDPYLQRNQTLGLIQLTDQTVVTSGTYERFFVDEATGKHYHHIFDSKTGYPADNGLTGVAIICGESIVGDCLSTAVFTMGLEGGMAFVETLPDVEAIFITDEHTVYLTSGMKGKLRLQSEEYTIAE